MKARNASKHRREVNNSKQQYNSLGFKPVQSSITYSITAKALFAIYKQGSTHLRNSCTAKKTAMRTITYVFNFILRHTAPATNKRPKQKAVV